MQEEILELKTIFQTEHLNAIAHLNLRVNANLLLLDFAHEHNNHWLSSSHEWDRNLTP